MVAEMSHMINVLIIAGFKLYETIKNRSLKRLLTPGAQLVNSLLASSVK